MDGIVNLQLFDNIELTLKRMIALELMGEMILDGWCSHIYCEIHLRN